MTDPILSPMFVVLFSILVAIFFWPTRGLISRWRQSRPIAKRAKMEDTLKILQTVTMEDRSLNLQGLAGSLQISVNRTAKLMDELEERKLVSLNGDQIRLTSSGQEYAIHILRVHRLWESFLAEQTGFDAKEWHERADKQEHLLSVEEADLLYSDLGFPKFDPHGDPIPNEEGIFEKLQSQPLANLRPKETGRIVHIEDEPDSIADQILAEELAPGMLVHQTEVSPHRVRFWSNGYEHVLAPIVAANIHVIAIPESVSDDLASTERLSSLVLGESAKVVQITPGCRGAERRRLLDLGILPGTVIEAELKSPSGDPTAYRIRGAVIALREEQAKFIRINRDVESSI